MVATSTRYALPASPPAPNSACRAAAVSSRPAGAPALASAPPAPCGVPLHGERRALVARPRPACALRPQSCAAGSGLHGCPVAPGAAEPMAQHAGGWQRSPQGRRTCSDCCSLVRNVRASTTTNSWFTCSRGGTWAVACAHLRGSQALPAVYLCKARTRSALQAPVMRSIGHGSTLQPDGARPVRTAPRALRARAGARAAPRRAPPSGSAARRRAAGTSGWPPAPPAAPAMRRRCARCGTARAPAAPARSRCPCGLCAAPAAAAAAAGAPGTQRGGRTHRLSASDGCHTQVHTHSEAGQGRR